MKNYFISLLLPGLLGVGYAEPDHPVVQLFDGESLAGWEVLCGEADADKEFWTVEEGMIICDSRGQGEHDYVWLMAEGEYADFELRLEFQAERESPGNSGVQVRSRFDPHLNGGWMHGPQVDIHPPLPWRTGFLYDETREVQHWQVPEMPSWKLEEDQAWPEGRPENWSFVYADQPERDGWNQLLIRCEGTHIMTELNGVEIIEWDGAGVLDDQVHQEAEVGLSGQIALQLHARDELLIRFRKIELKEL